ncbi:MAG: phenylalanine--tRNA ligase subunit beta, partial [Paludibacteraceae bacterium]|nr:phenylalanine--tRNA ligase subunit beta [Paludibacteraceae bacterium]
MNISYNWLKQYIDLTETPQQVADILTSIGLEVDGVEPVEQVKGGLRGIVIGRVLTCVAHENSDHLHVTTVDLGPELGVQQIVCGARNVAAGQTVVVATIGAVLYQGDESFTIKRAKMRGVESNGMICAEDEIGLGTGHDGIIVLAEPVAPGTPASQYFRLEDDAMIEVDITPNRADAISHYGVARDLNAYFAARGEERHLRRPQVEPLQAECDDLNIKVTVENTEACPIYSGVSIVGVQIAPSPEWMQKALRAVGLKPINNVVDATNYVMMELGQSLHSFDADKIKGRHIVVRNVAQDTPFTTLDGVERKLDAQDLLICNAEEPMCLAGVFGGLDSGITDQTVNVFLESAYFNPVTIRKTARRHGLSTDASFRYERGCDPNNTRFVLTRCANLIRQVAGGRISGDIVEVRSQDFPPFEVSMSLKKADSLIGKQIGQATVERILAALEIGVKSFDGDVYELLVPQYRVDVRRDVDVIEDLLRIYGYNNVEYSQKLNSSLSYSRKPDSNQLQNRISDMLSAQGFYEIMN